MNENPYQVLGLEQNASLDEIKQVYRQKIRQYHPDTFAGRKRELERHGDSIKLRNLEKEIQTSKQMTQRINEAYSILSDSERRATLDRKLSEARQQQYQREIRQQRSRHADVGRRTVKSRPHQKQRKTVVANEKFPWAIFVFLLVSLFIGSAVFSGAIVGGGFLETALPDLPTRDAGNSMADLQSTQNSRSATSRARSTLAAAPTSTPRSPETNELLGDRMMTLGQASRAVEAYTDALAEEASSERHFKRGLAYSELYFQGNEASFELALVDFEQALLLDNGNLDALRARGWLYYQAWLRDESSEFEEAAIQDFEAYLQAIERDADIEEALADLNGA